MIKIPKGFDTIEISKLKPNPKNVKIHTENQINGLAEAIKLLGIFKDPVVIDKKNTIWIGHGRVEAAKKLEMKSVPFLYLDHLDKKQRTALMILDNKLNESEWNLDTLQDILVNEIPNFDFEPFQTDFTSFLPEREIIEDEIPPIPDKPKSKLGDIYQLGNHRIMCGDNEHDYEILMNKTTVDQLVTDPPYGVDYGNKNKFLNTIGKGNHIEKEIVSDNIKDYQEFFKKFIRPVKFSMYNTIHICMLGKELVNLYLAMVAEKVTWGDFLVWVKNNHVLGRKDYNAKHEFVFYGWKGKHKFYGPSRTTVLEYNKPHVNDLHPTMKPVALMAQLITDGSPTDGVVYDPFLGSGSTLIACEQTNRKCYGMEIEPAYIDVTIKRWEDFTGKKAVKIK